MIKEIKYNRSVGRFKKYLGTLTEVVDDDIHPTHATYYDNKNHQLVITINARYKKAYIQQFLSSNINTFGLDLKQMISIIDEWYDLTNSNYGITLL